MELTVEFIRESFHKYNKKYFKSELIEPNFSIINTKTILGRFKCKKSAYSKNVYIIEISKYYLRNEKQYDNTIIHEMIHQYIKQKGIKDSSSHGYYFKSIANVINRDGWEIYRCNSMTNVKIAEENRKLYNVFMYHDNRGKYFLFVSAKSSIEVYKAFMKRYNYEYKYFTSSDSSKYGHFTACRWRIKGRYITKEEYDNLCN